MHELKRSKKRRHIKYGAIPSRVKLNRSKKFIKNTNSIKHEEFKAPSDFSLLNNTEEVLMNFEKAKKALQNNVPVFFDISDIENIGPETLICLCALVNDKQYTSGTALKGNSPLNTSLKQMFIDAGFYNFVISKSSQRKYSKDEHGEIIHRVTREKVEAELVGGICKSAIWYTFDTGKVENLSIFPILIECMANTRNHASGGVVHEVYNWWLLAYKEPITKISKFCILDLGVGIFSSLEKKFTDNTMPSRVKRYFVPNNNADTLKRIFKGEKRTRTQKPERGLGLNRIYSLVLEDTNIKNFTMLSNDVIAIIRDKNSTVVKLSRSFPGTLYYWELIPNNV